MRRVSHPRVLILLTSTILGIATTPPAEAFECAINGQGDDAVSLVWPDRTVRWVLDRGVLMNAGNGAVAEEDVRASFDAWDEVGCSDLTFVYDGIVDGATVGFENDGNDVNAVLWVSSGWPSDLDGALAVTTTSFAPSTGIVVDVDIELNGERFIFTRVGTTCNPRSNVQDLRNTLTHEVGHLVGLDHPPDNFEFRDTTMFATAPACETKKRDLAQDDVNGICFIYPTASPTQRCAGSADPTPADPSDDDDGGCTHVRANSPGFGVSGAALLLVALSLLWWRRR